MKREYIDINKNSYDTLAKEYMERSYSVDDNFYIKAKMKILEIGCGVGRMLKIFEDMQCKTVVVDLSKEMIKYAKIFSPHTEFICDDIQNVYFKKSSFDVIYMGAVIHNFPIKDVTKLLDNIYKWLKDDGVFICATTVDNRDYEGYESKVDYNNKEKRFRHHYTKESFDELFLNSKLVIYNKKYKREKDNKRDKLWQIVFVKKQ